jgi:Zn-dependent protease with chaperone function
VYQQELNDAFANQNTVLHKVSRIDSVLALKVLRQSLWNDFLMETQSRRTTFADRVGYYLCEAQIDSFKNRSYVLLPAEAPSLYALAAQYAAQLSISLPFFILVDDVKLCDANSANWDTNSGFIVLGRGLFEQYNEDQIKAVIGYQIGFLAKRTHAYLFKWFTPAVTALAVATIAGLMKINPAQMGTIPSGMTALGMISASGVTACLIWCYLMRLSQAGADSVLAKIDPKLGLALIAALEREYAEDDNGDVALAKKLVSELAHIDPSDRDYLLEVIKKIDISNNMRVAITSAVDSGIFGTQHTLEARKAFF